MNNVEIHSFPVEYFQINKTDMGPTEIKSNVIYQIYD